MTIPDDLLGMDYSFDAEPFVETAGKSSIDMLGMDYSFNAEPFVRYNFTEIGEYINLNPLFFAEAA